MRWKKPNLMHSFKKISQSFNTAACFPHATVPADNELELHNNSWSLRVNRKPTRLRLIKLFNITGCLERASMRAGRNFHNQNLFQSMPDQTTKRFNDTLVSVGLRGNPDVSRTCGRWTTKVNNLCKEGFDYEWKLIHRALVRRTFHVLRLKAFQTLKWNNLWPHLCF